MAWTSHCDGAEVGSWTDYILRDQVCQFQNCQLQVPQFAMDYNVIVGTLKVGPVRDHRKYVMGRQRFLI